MNRDSVGRCRPGARSLVVLVVLLLARAGTAGADSWPPPHPQTFASADQHSRVTITPSPNYGLPARFPDASRGGDAPGQWTPARAKMERLQADGRWQTVWQGPLLNRLAPVTALVANDGRYLVTFDDWLSTGYGDTVVVVYDARGEVLRRFGLEDFLPPLYLRYLPRSMSSIRWGGQHHFAKGEQILVLRVAQPQYDEPDDSDVEVRIRLADGQLLAPEGAAWARAYAKAVDLELDRRTRWQARRELRGRPLSPPKDDDPTRWREYLGELRARMITQSGQSHASILVMAANLPEFQDYSSDLAQRLDAYDPAHRDFGGRFLVVSPVPGRAAHVLAIYLAKAKPGALKGVHIAFVGTAAEEPRVRAAARRSGADIRLIDIARPFPGLPLAKDVPDNFLW